MQAAAATQMRVVGALILRETRTRFGKTQFGYLWALAEPLAVVASFTLMFTAMGRLPPYGNSLPMFFALGALAFQYYRRVASFCSSALDANRALLGYPIVKQVDTLVARALLESLTCLFVSSALISGLILFDDQEFPAQLGSMGIAALMLCLIGFGQGTISAVISSYFASWRNIDTMLSRPLFFMSGIFFVPDRMPPRLVEYLAWNPILHGLELMRSGYYPDYRSPTLDVWYLTYWALGLTVVGLAAERVMRLRAAVSDAGGA